MRQKREDYIRDLTLSKLEFVILYHRNAEPKSLEVTTRKIIERLSEEVLGVVKSGKGRRGKRGELG